MGGPPFEVFDETLTEEQLATLDALSGLGVGFIRTDTTVRADHGIAFYCYRGRATPSQFPHLPRPPYTSSSPGGGGRVPTSPATAQLEMECRLRTEMRGIAVHRPSRRLLCRPYHKFWHIGRAECLAEEVRELSSAPALPLVEKLDGVMVQGFMVDGRVYLATRSGRTNAAVEAESLLRGEEGQRWIRLCAVCHEAGYTPLFEFASPSLSTADHHHITGPSSPSRPRDSAPRASICRMPASPPSPPASKSLSCPSSERGRRRLRPRLPAGPAPAPTPRSSRTSCSCWSIRFGRASSRRQRSGRSKALCSCSRVASR